MIKSSNPNSLRLEFYPGQTTIKTVTEQLTGAGFHPSPKGKQLATIRYFDSFDWRLYLQNLELYRVDHEYVLTDRQSGLERSRLKWKRKAPLNMVHDLQEGELDERFAPALGNRALMEKLVLHREQQEFLPEGQSSCRLTLEYLSPRHADAHPDIMAVILEQQEGGRREFARLQDSLEAALGVAGTPHLSPLDRCAELMTPAPGSYSTRITTSLDPSMTCREAAVNLCRDIFTIMRMNEPGLLADTDTEFLHDYRVSVRRLRSLLSQLKKVFPPSAVEHFGNEFAVLGRFTNHLRDCDVLLENRTHYEMMLPESLRKGLLPFFKNIATVRRKEHRNLIAHLRSPHYDCLCTDWINFLNVAATLPATENSEQPVIELAGKMILRRFRRVVKNGKAITRTSHDQELHSLRIACKKLRYMMEFFSPLYEGRLNEEINAVKKIQNNLGDFNDLAIQIERLDARIRRSAPNHPNSLLTAAAVGGLIAMLAEEKFRLRDEFDDVFAAFSCSENIRMFENKFER